METYKAYLQQAYPTAAVTFFDTDLGRRFMFNLYRIHGDFVQRQIAEGIPIRFVDGSASDIYRNYNDDFFTTSALELIYMIQSLK